MVMTPALHPITCYCMAPGGVVARVGGPVFESPRLHPLFLASHLLLLIITILAVTDGIQDTEARKNSDG